MNIITDNRKVLFLKYKLKKIIRFFSKQVRLNVFGFSKEEINRVFVINLDRQKKRWELIQEELEGIEIQGGKRLLDFTERFSAVDGKKQSINTNKIYPSYKLEDQYFVDPNPQLLDIIREKEISINLTKQEIAVAMSHVSVWEKIVDKDIHSALILEDDVYFENKFSKKLNSLWKEVIESKIDFDIIFLSYKRVEYNSDIVEISDNLSKPNRGIWWFSGYILSNKGAQKLLKKLPIVGPVDLWINHQFKDIKVFTCNESIINQKLFVASDNNYSILPVLSQIGVKSNKTFIDLEKLKGLNPVFVFDFSNKKNLLAIETLLSLNSYRTYYNLSKIESDHIIDLVNRKEALLFDAYIGFDSLIDKIPSILKFYPNTIVIIIKEDNYILPEAISDYKGKKIFTIKSDLNLKKKIAKLLKIKNWNINSSTINIDFNAKTLKKVVLNNYKYLEHDVNPWVLPIEKMKKYLPYGADENNIMPIAKSILNKSDHFKEFDSNFWNILEDTFPSNLAQFSSENLRLSEHLSSGCELCVTNNTNNSEEEKKYLSASFVSKEQYLHGSFEISIKPAKGRGIVSAFFLHRNDPWQEIDIEFLGDDTTKILLNVYFNPGDENTNYNYGVRGTPIKISLGFDASESFHNYRIEWEYHEIRWYVDGQLIHMRKTWSPTPIPNLPMGIYANTWITASEDLAGKFDKKILPKSSLIKHIEIYDFEYNRN